MHLQSSVLLFLSALSVVTAQNPVCWQLAGYQPAVTFCGAKYPAPIPTVTRTSTKTITVKATTTSAARSTTPSSVKTSTSSTSVKLSTTSVTIKSSTSSASGQGRTRTITAVAEETITNCAGITRPTCPPTPQTLSIPGFPSAFNAGSSRPVNPNGYYQNRPTLGRVNARKAEPEPEPQFGGSFFSGWQAIVWARLLQSGSKNVENACSCLRPAPSKTFTVSFTATATATVR